LFFFVREDRFDRCHVVAESRTITQKNIRS
jgi:hypothetical protein